MNREKRTALCPNDAKSKPCEWPRCRCPGQPLPSTATLQSRDDEGLIARLRAYIPVEGQEGLAVRDKLLREAADSLEEAMLIIAEGIRLGMISNQSATTSMPDIPSIIRRSTWRTPELRESAARLVANILRPDDSECPPVPPNHFPVA